MIQAGGKTLLTENHKLIPSVQSKEQLLVHWKKSINVPS